MLCVFHDLGVLLTHQKYSLKRAYAVWFALLNMKHPSGFLKVIKCKKLTLTRLSYTHNVNMKTHYGEGSTCVCVCERMRKKGREWWRSRCNRQEMGDKNRTSCVREKRAASSLYVVYVYVRACVRTCACVVSFRRNLSHNTEECFGFLSNINRIHTYTWKSLDNRVMSVVPCLVSCHLELVSRCGPRQIHLQSNLEMCPHVPHKIFLRI